MTIAIELAIYLVSSAYLIWFLYQIGKPANMWIWLYQCVAASASLLNLWMTYD